MHFLCISLVHDAYASYAIFLMHFLCISLVHDAYASLRLFFLCTPYASLSITLMHPMHFSYALLMHPVQGGAGGRERERELLLPMAHAANMDYPQNNPPCRKSAWPSPLISLASSLCIQPLHPVLCIQRGVVQRCMVNDTCNIIHATNMDCPPPQWP